MTSFSSSQDRRPRAPSSLTNRAWLVTICLLSSIKAVAAVILNTALGLTWPEAWVARKTDDTAPKSLLGFSRLVETATTILSVHQGVTDGATMLHDDRLGGVDVSATKQVVMESSTLSSGRGRTLTLIGLQTALGDNTPHEQPFGAL
jgi:hypothetical protein